MFYRYRGTTPELEHWQVYWLTIRSYEANSSSIEVKIGDWWTAHYEDYEAFYHEWILAS